ncbi:hypothetical protein [Streptomyces sp. NPDC096311]|uniref:hypothetical protein n=1 Tax=Streptomyces sp. NPDC096311 TaxID=3366083 RepID=UPI0037FD10F9
MSAPGELWTFAGWGTVLLPSHEGRSVIVHGCGPIPAERSLFEVPDTTGYGFRLGEPLHLDLLSPGQLSAFLPRGGSVHPDLAARFNLPESPGAH